MSEAQPKQAPVRSRNIGSTSEEWHERRKKCIGGSDVPAIVGLSPWKTPVDVWMDKTGVVAPPAENEWMRWGKLLEPVIAAEYTLRTGRTLIPRGFFRHKDYDFIGGNIDAGIKGLEEGVEIKCSFSSKNWGPEGTDEIPLYYLCQVHHYMLVTGWKKWIVVVLIGGSMFRIYEIEKDLEAEELLKNAEIDFWENYVKMKVPPSIDKYSKAYARYLMRGVEKIAVCTESHALNDALLQDVFVADLMKKRAEEQFNKAKMHLVQAMSVEGCDKFYNESGSAHWYMTKGRRKTDWAAIVKECQIDPKIVDKHTKRGEPSDYFRVSHRLVEKEEHDAEGG